MKRYENNLQREAGSKNHSRTGRWKKCRGKAEAVGKGESSSNLDGERGEIESNFMKGENHRSWGRADGRLLSSSVVRGKRGQQRKGGVVVRLYDWPGTAIQKKISLLMICDVGRQARERTGFLKISLYNNQKKR